MSNSSPSSTIINHSWPKIHLGLFQCTGLGYFRAQTPCKKPMVSWFPHEKTLGFPTARRFLLEATLPKEIDLYLKNEIPKGSQSHMVRQNPRWGLEGSLIPSKNNESWKNGGLSYGFAWESKGTLPRICRIWYVALPENAAHPKKCQFHREDGENPLELWGSPYFFGKPICIFKKNMGWSWLVYECLLSWKKDGWVH